MSAASKLYEKLIRLPPTERWDSFVPGPRRLKFLDGFLHCVNRVKNSILIPAQAFCFPWLTLHIPYHLDLAYPVLKTECWSDVLFSIAIETIHIRYPVGTWLRILTDGSKNDMISKCWFKHLQWIFSPLHPIRNFWYSIWWRNKGNQGLSPAFECTPFRFLEWCITIYCIISLYTITYR